MFLEYPALHETCQIFLLFILGILSIMFLLCLIRIILGPAITDRLLGANVLGGISISAIAVLSIYLEEADLLDVALIYALISFLAVAILTKIYIGVKLDKRVRNKGKENMKKEVS